MELVIQRRQTYIFLIILRWTLLLMVPLMTNLTTYGGTAWVYAVFGFCGLFNIALTYFAFCQNSFRYQHVLWTIAWITDLLVITVLLIMRDGIRSDIYNLFYLTIVQAGMLYGLRGAAYTALASISVYCATIYGIHESTEALNRAIIRSIYFVFLGVLVGYLAKLEKSALINSLTDFKTRLPNYKYFHDSFKRELDYCNKHSRPLALAIIDLDNFKSINTKHGHLVGDQILTELAHLFHLMKQENEIFARYGGEEFVVMIKDTTEKDAIERLNHIREVVEKFSFRIEEGQYVNITLSMGLATLTRNEIVNELELLGRADQALAISKTSGKNCLTCWKQIPQAFFGTEPLQRGNTSF